MTKQCIGLPFELMKKEVITAVNSMKSGRFMTALYTLSKEG